MPATVLPRVMAIGATDPRVRDFSASVDGGPAPDNLDRLALFVPDVGASGAPQGGFGVEKRLDPRCVGSDPFFECPEPMWADIEVYGEENVNKARFWWKQAHDIGPLPEDWEGRSSEIGSAAQNWPESGDDDERRIYWWVVEPGNPPRLGMRMQLQKFNNRQQKWFVFNQWGHDLTFGWRPNPPRWEAGFDFGTWFYTHATTITAGVQIAMSAIITALSAGAGAPMLAATGAALAAQSAAIAAMRGVATGNFEEAFKQILIVAAQLAQVPVTSDAGKLIPKEWAQIANTGAVREIAKIVHAAQGNVDVRNLMTIATTLARTGEVKMGQEQINAARALVPAGWSQRLFDESVRRAAGVPKIGPAFKSIPWYAQPVDDFGSIVGAAASGTAGQKGSRVGQLLTEAQKEIIRIQMAAAASTLVSATSVAERDALVVLLRSLRSKWEKQLAQAERSYGPISATGIK